MIDKRHSATIEHVMKHKSPSLRSEKGRFRSRSSYQAREAGTSNPSSISSRPGSSLPEVNLGSKEILDLVGKKRNRKYAGLNSKVFKNSYYRYFKSRSKYDIRPKSQDKINQLGEYMGGSVDKRAFELDKERRKIFSSFDQNRSDKAGRKLNPPGPCPALKFPQSSLLHPNPIYKDSVFIKSRLLKRMGIAPSDILLSIDKCKEKIRCKLISNIQRHAQFPIEGARAGEIHQDLPGLPRLHSQSPKTVPQKK